MIDTITQIFYWPFLHEQTFWSLIITLFIGIAIGRGAHGHWRTWFN